MSKVAYPPGWEKAGNDPRVKFRILGDALLEEQAKPLPDFDKLTVWHEARSAYRAACLKVLAESEWRSWDQANNLSVSVDAFGNAKRYQRRQIQRFVAKWIDDRRHRKIWGVCWKSRQLGITTELAVQIYQAVTRGHGQRALITAQSDPDSAIIFEEKYKLLHANDPLAPKAARSNTTELLFPSITGHIRVRTAGGRKSAGRGGNIRFFHGSEAAWYEGNPYSFIGGILGGMTHPQSMAFLESTGNGQSGFFYEKVLEAYNAEIARQEGRVPEVPTDWEPIFLPFFMDDEAKKGIPFTSEEERHQFKQSMRDDEKLIQQEKQLADEVMNWYRMIFNTKAQGESEEAKIMWMYQEFPYCLTADARISTEKGIIRIADAQLARLTESGPISRWIRRPVSPILKMTTALGRVLRGTADHPIHTPDEGFVRLDDIKPGQNVTLRPPRFADERFVLSWRPFPGMESRIEIDETWGKFLGYFMGDGCWTRGTLEFACDSKDLDVIEDVRDVITKIAGEPGERQIGKQRGVKGCTVLRLSKKAMQGPLAELGCIRDTSKGQWARWVRVPEPIWRSPKPVVREFLRALFESDGSSSGGRISFATSKEQFARDVQLLLLGFGIPSIISVQRKPRHGRPGQFFESWSVALRQLAGELFLREIGFVGARKNACQYHKRRGVHPESEAGARPTHGRTPMPLEMLDEVVSVEPDGEEETFDLTVEGEHAFSANGILTHNCPMVAFQAPGSCAFDAPALVSLKLKNVKQPIWVGNMQVPGARPGVQPLYDPKADEHLSVTPMPQLIKRSDGQLRIFAMPKSGRRYQIGADFAESGGKKSDNTEYYVLDYDTEEIVAHFCMRSHDPLAPLVPLRLLSKLYNDAMINPEANRGKHIIALLALTDRRDRLFVRESSKVEAGVMKWSRNFGFEMRKNTKAPLVDLAREKLSTKPHTFIDAHLIDQMLTFTQVQTEQGDWTYPGAVPGSGNHDDGVDAYMLALRGIMTMPHKNPHPKAEENGELVDSRGRPLKNLGVTQRQNGHFEYERNMRDGSDQWS